jgi:hypothetical protein
VLEQATPLQIPEGDVLDPLVQAQCSLAVQLRRATGSIIGRSAELSAFAQEIRDAKTRLSAVTLEGEPGIGKTRLLLAAAELATAAGFTTIAVTADEEIRGPFLVAKSLFAAPAIRDTAAGTKAESAVRRVNDAISGRDEPGFETLSPDAKLLRAFDLAGIAIGALADIRPLALLIDDAQWADDDTLRMLRYVVRSDADRPVFLFLTIRPDEFAGVTEAVNFVADMERMGLVRRLRPTRFSAIETAELLKNVLGGPVDHASAAAMQVQSEGVPFIVEELARTHREAGTLQQVDGEWKLGRNAARLVPSAVRTLIQRRAARLPAPTREVLSDAAVLGRSFSLRDLRAVRSHFGGDGADLADALRPAVDAGLLLQHPEGSAADYTFTHEQVREFSDSLLTTSRRRQVHGAVVDLLLEGGEPEAAGLPMLAQHALAAGDTERAAQFSIDAAAAALKSNAPEEALRLVEQALPVVSTPTDRRTLLTCRDDAYAVLRKTSERLQGLAELSALAEALGDPALEFDVQLRRAAALRAEKDDDAAAELARRVASRAAARGDKAIELRATLELGQAILRTSLGEGYSAASTDVDIPAADAAFTRAAELAAELGDDRARAAAIRELGTLNVSKVRDWFVEQLHLGTVFEFAARITRGETVDDVLASQSIAPVAKLAQAQFEEALAIFERLGDRTGVMATVIAMAYGNYAPMIHLASSARHIEEIRRVTSRLTEFVTESERARQELQMLFGVHVYARAKVVPDLMLSRGEEAWKAARLLGDQATEFNAAGGVAMGLLDLGDVAEAERWIGRAADVAASSPSSSRARRLELWRGTARGRAGDAAGMRRHLEQAVALAAGQGKAAARCEALATLALEAARLGAERQASGGADAENLFALAEETALQVRELVPYLPGHPSWGPQADAALATVRLARGELAGAVEAGTAAIGALQESGHEDSSLEILIPVGKAILAGGAPEMQGFVRGYIGLILARIAQGTLDEQMRVRWLRGPLGRQLVELAGPLDDEALARHTSAFDTAQIDDIDRRLLRLMTEGHTNAEMAAQVGLSSEDVGVRLAKLLAALGVSSRAEATTLAFKGFTAMSGAR